MQSKKIKVFGIETHYLETENTEGEPLLILHGWGSSKASWKKVALGLEARGRHVIVPDLPGFGETHEPDRPWRAKDYVEYVKSFANLLGFKKFSLAGHSFGGQIAIVFAVAHQKNLNKLVLLAAARIVKRRKLKVAVLKTLTKIGNIMFFIPPLFFIKPIMRKVWYKVAGEKDYYRASKLMRNTMKLVLEKEVVGNILHKIQTPTLVLWGEKDYVTPLEDGEIVHGQIPNSTLRLLKDEGHDINITAPDKIVEEIDKFL